MTNADKIKLIETLARDYDHVFLDEEGARNFSEPFGFTARTYVAHANPREPKGLTLRDGAKAARGISADDLAYQIASHLKVPTNPDLTGRGFRLRSACEAIVAYLKA